MKTKKIIISYSILLYSFFILTGFASATSDAEKADQIKRHNIYSNYTDEEKTRIINLITSSKVIAITNKSAVKYNTYDETGGRLGMIDSDEQVEIVQDKGAEWYKVRKRNCFFWLKAEDLDIPEDKQVKSSVMTKEELEAYAYFMDLESKTDHYVLVDISRQITHIFKGEKDNWTLERSMACSSGKNISPTTRGLFETSEKGEWFYSERLHSGAKYWYRFNGSYLFHSIAMDENGNIQDDVLGEKRSMGCIRLSLEDIKWFYDNIPEDTCVLVM